MQENVGSFTNQSSEQTNNEVANTTNDVTNVEQNSEMNKQVSENTTNNFSDQGNSITQSSNQEVFTETQNEQKSSLTSDRGSEGFEKPTNPNPVFSPKDEELFKHLSDKLGIEVSSLEDLKPKEVNIDPQVKALNDWKEKTGRPIEDFFKFNKDYSTVSDIDIAREALQLEYPTLSKEDIELELSTKFISDEDDLDIDIARKNLELKKYATKGRQALEQMKADLGKPSDYTLTPEIRQEVEFAKQMKKQIEDNKVYQTSYNEGITKATVQTESVPLKLSDDFSIDYKISQEDKRSLQSFINEMPHWRNEDGSQNFQEIVKDSVKIKYFDNIVKLAYEQGRNAGKDQVVKDAKNITIDQSSNMNTQQNIGRGKPTYENFPKYLV